MHPFVDGEEIHVFKKIVLMSALLSAGLAQAFVPQAGTWVIDAENNGQPGRGFGLDVQNNTLVMQMYAYESSGAPTFYLSAGAYRNGTYSGQLGQYRNGRYLGSGARDGVATGSAGVVSMRFVSGTQGFITFPGEAEKSISRYSFAYNSSPESLRGIWLLNGIGDYSVNTDFIKLDRISAGTSDGSGIVSSTDGRMACENMVKGSLAGKVLCIKLNSSGQLSRGYLFVYSVNDGEGLSGPKDSPSDELLVVRRLANADSVGTGVLVKATPASAESPEVTPQQLQDAMAQFAEQVRQSK